MHDPIRRPEVPSPLEMSPEAFRRAGHALVDRVAEFLGTLRDRPLHPDETPGALRALLGDGGLPLRGSDPGPLLEEATDLVLDHSLFNGHPGFMGYITSSAAPIGALADLLASSVNPNLGGWPLSPIACEIEGQTVRWIAEFLRYPVTCGGILVSGGNMANFVGFWAARRARAGAEVRATGLEGRRLRVYTSQEIHTCVHKAADRSGPGTDSIRWIPVGADLRMDTGALRERIAADRAAGDRPFLVVGTAGSVSTGAIDPIREIAEICRREDLWFHVDGAYGAPAAGLPDADPDLASLALADSLAVDPHKWFYAPIEAGCTLVRSPEILRDTFSYAPAYYPQEAQGLMYHEYGPQNSRGFRALKVWLGLRQAGREGLVRMIAEDVALARYLHRAVEAHDELETGIQGLSVTAFRYVPPEGTETGDDREAYLNRLNEAILHRLESSREVFVSRAVIRGRFHLRSCVVNFRTTDREMDRLVELTVQYGRELHAAGGSRVSA